MIYIAQPYSSNPTKAYELATRLTAQAIEAGYDVFSPVLHFHPTSEINGLDNRSHAFWIKKCLPFLNSCDAAIFVNDIGYERSKGMEIERLYCAEVGKPTGVVDDMDMFCEELGRLFVKVAHLQPSYENYDIEE